MITIQIGYNDAFASCRDVETQVRESPQIQNADPLTIDQGIADELL
jgi:hypothetical protein